MEPYCAGKICYFALDGNHPVIVRHRNAGGQALFVRDNTIILAEGPRSSRPVAGPRAVDAAAGRSASTSRTRWPPSARPWP